MQKYSCLILLFSIFLPTIVSSTPKAHSLFKFWQVDFWEQIWKISFLPLQIDRMQPRKNISVRMVNAILWTKCGTMTWDLITSAIQMIEDFHYGLSIWILCGKMQIQLGLEYDILQGWRADLLLHRQRRRFRRIHCSHSKPLVYFTPKLPPTLL